MIPTWIELRNYGPFRGEHRLELRPLIYAITARDEEDAERSNWIGKSFFMSAFRFVLFGEHPRRTEDEWITDGEAGGHVAMDLEGGITLTRARQRGKSTQLTLKRGGSEAKQDRAQEIVDRLVGFSKDDFDASCWVKQKQAHRLITADPAPRFKMVAGWMDLGDLQAAEEVERGRLSAVVEKEGELKARAEQLAAMIEEVGDPAGLADRIEELEASIALDEGELAEAEGRLERAEEASRLARLEMDLQSVVAQGKALKAAMAEQGGGPVDAERVRQAEMDAEVALQEAQREVRRIGDLLYGAGFDGRCPVTSGQCPVADDIMSESAQMQAQHDEAQRVSTAALDVKRRTSAARSQLEGDEARRQSDQGRLQNMRETAVRMIADIDEMKARLGDDPPDVDLTRATVGRLQAKIGIDRGELAQAGRTLSGIDGWVRELRGVEADREALAPRLKVHREAMVVLGRGGAQREIAEGNLAEIEAGANDLMAGAGIDLSVSVRWGREGGGLATHCGACGQPFPTSRRVKECQGCGAARGPKMVEKLELQLSSSSDGAAEDVGGLAMQVSAAAWLRARRQAAWSAMFIDEPFSGTDARVGQQLAARLRSMLGGRYSFRQAFVISHSASTLDVMPGRIEIVRAKDGTLSVEAS